MNIIRSKTNLKKHADIKKGKKYKKKGKFVFVANACEIECLCYSISIGDEINDDVLFFCTHATVKDFTKICIFISIVQLEM